MTMTIFKHEIADPTQEIYEVTFFEDTILAIVTATPSCVDKWISFIQREYDNYLHSLVIGVDIQRSPSRNPNKENPIAILQLCVGRHCLIFQILHATTIPQSLHYFLGDLINSFVGVGIGNNREKLLEDWSLLVDNVWELGELAAEEYGIGSLVNARLKGLTKKVMGKELSMPEDVKMSKWDNKVLTPAQVQFASVSAFLNFEIGKILFRRKIDAINSKAYSQIYALRND